MNKLEAFLENKVRTTVITILGLLVLYLMYVAIRLQVDFFDSFELFLSAQTFASLTRTYYAVARPVGAVLLTAPFFFLEKHFGAPGLGLVLAHMSAVFVYSTLLYISYRIFRLTVGISAAAIATLLLSFNAILLRVAPLGKEDVLGSLVFTVAVYFYLKYEGKIKRHLVFAGLFIGLAMSIRYNLLGLGVLVFAATEMLSGKVKTLGVREIVLRALFLGILPVLAFFFIVVFVYGLLGLSSVFDAPSLFIQHLLKFVSNNLTAEDPWQYVVFLWKGASPLGFLAMLSGVGVSISRNYRHHRLYIVWFTVISLGMAYGIGHKEARYLLPALPAFYYFVAVTIEEILSRVKVREKKLAIIGFLGIWPASIALGECVRFLDKVYSRPFASDISSYALSLAGSDRLIWTGNMYSVNPKDYLFDRDDEFTSIYHLWGHVIMYYTGREVPALQTGFIARENDWVTHLDPNTVVQLKDGDTLIVNVEPVSDASNIPDRREPIVVEKVKYHVFNRGILPTMLANRAYTLAIQTPGTQRWVAVKFIQPDPNKKSIEAVVQDALKEIKIEYSSYALITYVGARQFSIPQ